MGASCCKGQNEDPYTLQKGADIDKLNKASNAGKMIEEQKVVVPEYEAPDIAEVDATESFAHF